MNMKISISSICAALLLTGCATSSNDQVTEIQQEDSQLQSEVVRLDENVNNINEVESRSQASNYDAVVKMLPPNAKAGECYARILTPATYRTDTRDMLKKEATYRIEVTEPEYVWETEQVMVKEASEVAELAPAKYDWSIEKVLVSEAYDELKTIPATYDTKTEKVLVKSAYTTWKKGRGPIEKVNNATGEIMCLVEVPAEYKTITSTVMVTPARTEKVTHPAVYKDIKKRVMVESPKMIKREIPAEYKTVKVKKIVRPAQEKRIEIPVEYQTVTNRVKVTDSFLEWRSILCETNTTEGIIQSLQRALLNAGHNPGPIDGIIGDDTMQAVKNYQQEKNLAYGQITIETLKSLGVNYK